MESSANERPGAIDRCSRLAGGFENYKGGPSVGSNANALIVARSTDGGDAWETQILVKNNASASGSFSLLAAGF